MSLEEKKFQEEFERFLNSEQKSKDYIELFRLYSKTQEFGLKDEELETIMNETIDARPYIKGEYNPKFGNDKECECGHAYYRHFDSCDEMYPCGCKYCGCNEFKEKSKIEGS